MVEKEVKIEHEVFYAGIDIKKHNNWPRSMSKELKGVHKMVSKEVQAEEINAELAEYIRELGVVHEIVVGITSEKELRDNKRI